MQYTITQAARFTNRILEPLAKVHAEAHAADRGFDFGEFSDGAHARIWHDRMDAVANAVGARTGFTGEEIQQEMMRCDFYYHPGYY